jgi:glutamine cyclotransferase
MGKKGFKKTHKQASVKKKQSPLTIAVVVIILLAMVGFVALGMFGTGQKSPSENMSSSTSSSGAAKKVEWEIVNSYPHDPEAFLQGLVWYDNGFYEGTGLYGQSSLRRVEFPSGKVLKKIDIAKEFFGEGIAVVNNHIIQLTWQSHKGFVYDRETFTKISEFTYPTEGWGLTYDGKNLILSDGSSSLFFLDPETFQTVRKLDVTMNGTPLPRLNELEYIDGEIWSNVWQTDRIVRINPTSGQVTSFLDMTGILTRQNRTGNEDVLNGIAYDAQQKRIFISGKQWPKIFEIKLKN